MPQSIAGATGARAEAERLQDRRPRLAGTREVARPRGQEASRAEPKIWPARAKKLDMTIDAG